MAAIRTCFSIVLRGLAPFVLIHLLRSTHHIPQPAHGSTQWTLRFTNVQAHKYLKGKQNHFLTSSFYIFLVRTAYPSHMASLLLTHKNNNSVGPSNLYTCTDHTLSLTHMGHTHIRSTLIDKDTCEKHILSDRALLPRCVKEGYYVPLAS